MFAQSLDSEAIYFWSFFGVIVLLAIIISIYQSKKEKQRVEALKDYCRKSGVVFSEEVTRVPNNAAGFSVLADKGHTNKWNNEMYGNRNGIDFYMFEHYSVSGYGKNRSVSLDTICILVSDEVNLPQFYLRDEYFLYDDLGKLFGGQDINFQEDPVFSKNFVLQGRSELAIRQFFGNTVRQAFVNNHTSGYVYEGGKDCFALVKSGRLDVEGRATILSDALKIFNQLKPVEF